MLSRAAKLDAECLPSTVHFSCSPTGKSPLRLLLLPFSKQGRGGGGGVERLALIEGLLPGQGSAESRVGAGPGKEMSRELQAGLGQWWLCG